MPSILVTSRANPRVKQLRAAFGGNARLSGGLVAIEGENLLREALRCGLPLKTIFLSERVDPPAWLPRGVELLTLPHDVFASAADTQHPQGIAALLVPPTWQLEDAFPPDAKPLLLIAAGLQDPGNFGTLVRSAEAFGATAVLTTPGTVSEWNQKALRASAGSVFRMPVVAIAGDQLADLKSRGLTLLATVADDPSRPTALPAANANLRQPCALMIGNEGAGLSAEFLALADARITLPMPGRVESLNAAVAGSLLLYEASRQRQAVPGLQLLVPIR
ncbi:MAG TPA: RNA methyltransferase [Acidobacteriaceae bacterium]